MRKLAILASGEAATEQELTDGLECLNDLLNSWAVERLILPYTTSENFSLVVGTSSYTIGSSGDFDTNRPIDIVQAFIRDSNSTDHLLDICSYTQYNQLSSKGASNRPTVLYYKANYPLGVIYFNTAPTSSENLYIESIKHLTEFPDSTTDIDILPELKSALVYNLALELAPEFGISPAVLVLEKAQKTLNRLRSSSMAALLSPVILNLPINRAGTYNIDSDI
jgi:hypothetical protein